MNSNKALEAESKATAGIQQKRRPTFHLWLTTLVVTIGITLPGVYQTAIVNSPEATFERFENSSFENQFDRFLGRTALSTLWGFTVAVSGVGALVAAVCIPYLTRVFGRRKTLFYFGATTTCAAGICEFSAYYLNAFELFIFGQFLGSGVGLTLAWSVGTVYVTECSPAEFRGMFGTLISLSGFGNLLAYVLGLPMVLGSDNRWPWYAMVLSPLVAASLALMWCCRESPKHLYIFRSQVEKARKSIVLYYGKDFDANAEFQHYQNEVKMASSSQATLKELFMKPQFRRPLIISCLAQSCLTLAGPQLLAQFSTNIYQSLNFDQFTSDLFTIACALPMPLLTIASSLVVDRWGRRPLLLLGLALCMATLCLFILFNLLRTYAGFHSPALGYAAIIVIFLNQWIAALGPGPISNFLFSELFPQTAMSIGTSVMLIQVNLLYILVTLLFPPLQDAIGYLSIMVLQVVPCFACTVYLYFAMPETKNKPADEIVAMFLNQKQEETEPVNDGNCLITEVLDDDTYEDCVRIETFKSNTASDTDTV